MNEPFIFKPLLNPEAVGYPRGIPYVRQSPKVGRNDPCPCGCGRKYKKCQTTVKQPTENEGEETCVR